MRLVRELAGAPPSRTPANVAEAGGATLLRWIFAETMGAKIAFEMRQTELGPAATDADVVRSFLDDLAPDGDLSLYLAACQLAFRAGETLFVHGAVTSDNVGIVPGSNDRSLDPDAWIAGLNAFYAAQVEAFRDRRIASDGTSGWASLVAYQAPLPGTRLNQ